ncbi:GNAT family N-acetyltransferase [Streptomyces sp. ISL-112]|uniref:GNAT family N-acetyltransferase n=1 Tax=Streptomyces sp. ISL-112 TaxID=2819176 RepID=UPI001BE842F8|nr:GNAT family N-acetyltransferase [Streptomyces sp. ISL-112]
MPTPSPVPSDTARSKRRHAHIMRALVQSTHKRCLRHHGAVRPVRTQPRTAPRCGTRHLGLFMIDLDGAMIGMAALDRRDAERPGHVCPKAGEAELGYTFLPEAWGCGYAAEACAAALDWFTDVLPDELVVLCTQTANVRSMRLAAKLGFTEVERFEEYGAEQWFGVWSSVTPSG